LLLGGGGSSSPRRILWCLLCHQVRRMTIVGLSSFSRDGAIFSPGEPGRSECCRTEVWREKGEKHEKRLSSHGKARGEGESPGRRRKRRAFGATSSPLGGPTRPLLSSSEMGGSVIGGGSLSYRPFPTLYSVFCPGFLVGPGSLLDKGYGIPCVDEKVYEQRGGGGVAFRRVPSPPS